MSVEYRTVNFTQHVYFCQINHAYCSSTFPFISIQMSIQNSTYLKAQLPRLR